MVISKTILITQPRGNKKLKNMRRSLNRQIEKRKERHADILLRTHSFGSSAQKSSVLFCAQLREFIISFLLFRLSVDTWSIDVQLHTQKQMVNLIINYGKFVEFTVKLFTMKPNQIYLIASIVLQGNCLNLSANSSIYLKVMVIRKSWQISA